ncbi:MAG: anaerobic glycerol-3-phosphate dehydrogenase subunit B [Bacteroidales bacterium]|nr:anaerobic glycerol-3-phosphate dehydrogenase subunit B [Bacteroidales bacterium]
MRFDTVIIGGGLAGLTAGIALQREGKSTAIISTGQNALHFFSGSFESVVEKNERMIDFFAKAGIPLHYAPGVRLMPLGSFRPSALCLEDTDIFPTAKVGSKVLIVNFMGYHDFFSTFLAEGLEKEGMQCRIRLLDLPELEPLQRSPGGMRSVQMARILDPIWEKFVQEVRLLIKDEDIVVIPQVFGLKDPSTPGLIREDLPVRAIFAGTLPPSVPGIRTQQLLGRNYERLGGTYLKGDHALRALTKDNRVIGVSTKNLDRHYLKADTFILASGSYFSKGLRSNPFEITEPVFDLDVNYSPERSDWYNPKFAADQPYMHYGVKTDENLHAIKGGTVIQNLYAIGSVMGVSHPRFGFGAGLAIRSAFHVTDQIVQESKV